MLFVGVQHLFPKKNVGIKLFFLQFLGKKTPPFFGGFFFLYRKLIRKLGGAGGTPLAVTQEDCLVNARYFLLK